MKKYVLIKQDTTKKLKLGEIYNIEDNCIINEVSMKLYRLTDYQLKNMFKEVK